VSQTSARHAAAHATAGLRFDIQGLRAFAVLAVVLYHLWPGRLPGGFVGVDVFFVVSGYLISSHLVRELTSTGRIELGRFWARRALRLLPAAFLVLITTATAVVLALPRTVWQQYLGDAVASALYVQNWNLATSSVDYLAAFEPPSPFQHFWSLSVEEQFYVALPLVLLVSAIAARRVSVRVRAVVPVVLGAVVVLSFAWSSLQTTTAPDVAYFSTATRAWEFALGGLVAVAVVRRPSAVVSGVLAWSGVAALVASLWVITPETPFPGSAALLPVVGAALVIAFGERSGLSALGKLPPVAFLGRISYGVYLWHWPLVVILPSVTGRDLSTVDKLAVMAATLGLASASTVFFEEKLRFARRVRSARPRVVGLVAVATTVAVLASAAVPLAVLDRERARDEAFVAELSAGSVECFGAAARDPDDQPCVNDDLADVRVPAPAALGTDDSNEPECWSNDETGTFNVCTLGPKDATTRLFAVGDSHNNTLIGAYGRIAADKGWRIDVAGRGGCYWTTATQELGPEPNSDACVAWRAAATAYVEDTPGLTAVVVTHSSSDRPVVAASAAEQERATVDGLVDAWSTATRRGIPVIAVRDNPAATPTTADCVAAMTGPTDSRCDVPRSEALSTFDGQEEAVEVLRPGAGTFVDLTDLMCGPDTCPAVIGGVVVHRDRTHLTDTFARTLAPFLGRALDRAISP
jgi:peptidoglycan/LPS O-acetylase OafA/YrhL